MSGNLSADGFTVVMISETTADTINATSTEYYPDSAGVDIDEGFKLITITVVADYALTGAVEVSDDGANWYQYYPADGTDFTLTANRLKSMSYEEDYYHVRLKLINGDGSNHTVTIARFKGIK